MTQLGRIITAFFSPTGGTKKVSMALQEGFFDGLEGLDFNIITYNYLTPAKRERIKLEFSPSDLLVFTFPVYYGRMPWALQQWPQLKGNGAKAIIVSVYGNRAIEDGTRETAMMLKEHGFTVIGNIEALAEHPNLRTMAHGRPNQEDKETLKQYAQDILKLYKRAIDEGKDIQEMQFDMTTPLKDRGVCPSTPYPDPVLCDHCGRCVNTCPMNIIDAQTKIVPEENLKKCMGCRACIFACPNRSRKFSEQASSIIQARMEQVQAAHPNPYPYKCVLSPLV